MALLGVEKFNLGMGSELVSLSWLRLPGVENVSVFIALRGVIGGGGIRLPGKLEAAFLSSSSSLDGQS